MLQALHADARAGLHFTRFCELSGNPVRESFGPLVRFQQSLYVMLVVLWQGITALM